MGTSVAIGSVGCVEFIATSNPSKVSVRGDGIVDRKREVPGNTKDVPYTNVMQARENVLYYRRFHAFLRLPTLDDVAFGAASDVAPKFVSPSDPAAQWTGAQRGPAFFAYSDNYLIDVKFGIIMDVVASRAIRQAEVGAAKT